MKSLYIFFLFVCCAPLMMVAQETQTEDKPERPAFESNFLIDNPTDKIYLKNSLEVVFQHRFGTIGGGTNDLAGIWAPANIRIGLSYAILDWLQVGFGTTKFERLQDFNWKVGLLRQTRSGSVPVNISYYGNFAINARTKENFSLEQDRYSFFHQLIISRRFSPNLSLQVAPSLSHYNLVPEGMPNDLFGVAFGGRYKVSPQTAILMDWSIPIVNITENKDTAGVVTDFPNGTVEPFPGFSLGMEFVTSSHAFQVYLSSYNGIVPQVNYFKNQKRFLDGWDGILLGFTITRLYNF
ncbi:MAG: DUF5777 family beta-barrel protein [Robiginitalea sp.]